jgi:hypothetical protein
VVVKSTSSVVEVHTPPHSPCCICFPLPNLDLLRGRLPGPAGGPAQWTKFAASPAMGRPLWGLQTICGRGLCDILTAPGLYKPSPFGFFGILLRSFLHSSLAIVFGNNSTLSASQQACIHSAGLAQYPFSSHCPLPIKPLHTLFKLQHFPDIAPETFP